MATVTGLTAQRMLEIEAESIVAGRLDTDGNLILKNFGGQEFNVGSLKGPQGDPGPGGTITSINGKTGSAINLTAADLGSIDGTYAASTERIGLVELATGAETQSMIDTAKVVTAADLASLTPSVNRLGMAKLATAAQVATGTSPDTFISPLLLAGHPGTPFAMAVGTVNQPAATVGNTSDAAVTFPVNRFSQPPIIVFLPGSNRYNGEVLSTSRTKTGFTARVTNFTQNITNVTVGFWIAIQMTSASAAG